MVKSAIPLTKNKAGIMLLPQQNENEQYQIQKLHNISKVCLVIKKQQ